MSLSLAIKDRDGRHLGQLYNPCKLSKQAGPGLGACLFWVLDVFLFLAKAKIYFTILIDFNVHRLDIAGIKLVFFTVDHVSSGHFVDLS